MFDLFSDIVTYRSETMERIDPRMRLAGAFALILAVILSKHVVLPLAVLGVSVAAMLALRIPPRMIALRLASPLALVAVLVALHALAGGGRVLAQFHFWGLTLSVTEDGLWRGALMAARAMGAVAVMVWLGFVMPAHQIFRALRWFGVPRIWVEVAMLMYRYVFVLLDQATDVATAQRARLGYADFSRTLSSLGTLSGTVLVRSYDQSVRTHEAMLLRGYNGTMPFGPLPPLRRRGWLLLLAIPLCAALVFCAVEYGGTLR